MSQVKATCERIVSTGHFDLAASKQLEDAMGHVNDKEDLDCFQRLEHQAKIGKLHVTERALERTHERMLNQPSRMKEAAGFSTFAVPLALGWGALGPYGLAIGGGLTLAAGIGFGYFHE